jgi:hypothetical protein
VTRSKVMSASILSWVLLTVVWACVYVVSNVTSPDAVGYERLWDFQLVFFVLNWMPFLLGVLFVLLWVAHRWVEYRGTPK